MVLKLYYIYNNKNLVFYIKVKVYILMYDQSQPITGILNFRQFFTNEHITVIM